jgi:nucleoside-diphosphate-sugar epimerase
MKRIAVTGAGGFIGRAVSNVLMQAGCAVIAIVRRPYNGFDPAIEQAIVPDLADAPDPSLIARLEGVETVVHLADNANRTAGYTHDPAIARGVGNLASTANIRRAIYASSIYASRDEAGAVNPYGAYKRASEAVLQSSPGLATVVLRLPPIYGPGGGGGLAILAGLVGRGVPLPIGLATAPRDYLSRDNLAALIAALAMLDDDGFAELAETVWEPSDGNPVSTRDLAKAIGEAIGRPARVFPMPPTLVAFAAGLAGWGEQAAALFEPLACANSSVLRRIARWQPCTERTANLSYLAAASPEP